MKQNENRGRMIPNWSWRKELAEVMKCGVVAVAVLSVLAILVMLAFDAYHAQQTNDPAQSSMYSNAAEVGGSINAEGDYNPKNPHDSSMYHADAGGVASIEDGSGMKDPLAGMHGVSWDIGTDEPVLQEKVERTNYRDVSSGDVPTAD